MVATRYESVTAHDGRVFDAYRALPDAANGRASAPGIVLFQEVFGVNDNIRGLTERLADHGYVVLVPDMVWRRQRCFESEDESELAVGMALAGWLDFDSIVMEMTSTLARIRAMPECSGKVGGVGFCLGGTLAYLFATSARCRRRW